MNERVYPIPGSEPLTKKVRLSGRGHIVRGQGRSTIFAMQIDISGLMDSEGHPLCEGEFLEKVLFNECKHIIQSSLNQARAKIPNHP